MIVVVRRRRGMAAVSDDAELSVDVMRFFAIVAMILFAVMARIDPTVPPPSDLVIPTIVVKEAPVVLPQSPGQSVMWQKRSVEPLNREKSMGDQRAAVAGEVRFRDHAAFSSAVDNGFIDLIFISDELRYHWVPSRFEFRPLHNLSARAFGVPGNEIPNTFVRVAKRIRDALGNRSTSALKWYVTMPANTQSRLMDNPHALEQGAILDGTASPI